MIQTSCFTPMRLRLRNLGCYQGLSVIAFHTHQPSAPPWCCETKRGVGYILFYIECYSKRRIPHCKIITRCTSRAVVWARTPLENYPGNLNSPRLASLGNPATHAACSLLDAVHGHPKTPKCEKLSSEHRRSSHNLPLNLRGTLLKI